MSQHNLGGPRQPRRASPPVYTEQFLCPGQPNLVFVVKEVGMQQVPPNSLERYEWLEKVRDAIHEKLNSMLAEISLSDEQSEDSATGSVP